MWNPILRVCVTSCKCCDQPAKSVRKSLGDYLLCSSICRGSLGDRGCDPQPSSSFKDVLVSPPVGCAGSWQFSPEGFSGIVLASWRQPPFPKVTPFLQVAHIQWLIKMRVYRLDHSSLTQNNSAGLFHQQSSCVVVRGPFGLSCSLTSPSDHLASSSSLPQVWITEALPNKRLCSPNSLLPREPALPQWPSTLVYSLTILTGFKIASIHMHSALPVKVWS